MFLCNTVLRFFRNLRKFSLRLIQISIFDIVCFCLSFENYSGCHVEMFSWRLGLKIIKTDELNRLPLLIWAVV